LAEQTQTLATTLESARQELLALPGHLALKGHRAGRQWNVRADAVDLSVGADAALGVLAAALIRAETAVTLVDPGCTEPGCAGAEYPDPDHNVGWLWPKELDQLTAAALDRGCRVRAMFGRYPLCQRAQRFSAAVTDGGGEVRIVPTPGFPMLAVDTSTVLAPHRGPGSVPTMATITSPDVVRLLRGFADLTWERAEPAAGGPAGQTTVLLWAGSNADLKKKVVELLTTGAKDERIARLLGISLRTCRRHIAEIMSELGAGSRFQAGANAARVGLIRGRPAP
jgi:DNA-binding CsgD family transcriptional regulator